MIQKENCSLLSLLYTSCQLCDCIETLF